VKNRKIFEKREKKREKRERKKERKEKEEKRKREKEEKKGKKREPQPTPARAHFTYPRLKTRLHPLYPSPFTGQGRSPLDPHARRDA
jgi:hypothetical protein